MELLDYVGRERCSEVFLMRAGDVEVNEVDMMWSTALSKTEFA